MIKASTNVPRGCVKSSWAGEAAQQQPRHGQVDDRLRGGGEELIVLAEPPEPAQPGKGPLHHPPARDHRERRHDRRARAGREPARLAPAVVAGHDLEADAAALLGPVQEGAAVAAIDPAVPQPRKPASVQVLEQLGGAVAVAHIGGGHTDLADQPEGSTSRWRLRPLTFLAPSSPWRPPVRWSWCSGCPGWPRSGWAGGLGGAAPGCGGW